MKRRNVLPCTGGGGGRLTRFPMAEILLSLTIIGVVAAITLPSLTGNINERTWNTQRKALYARFSQAIALMPALNGYSGAETFVTAGLSKVLKINNICDNEHLSDCGIADKIVALNGDIIGSMPLTLASYNDAFTSANKFPNDTDAAAFETANGESVTVYYNPSCTADMQETDVRTQTKMCVNFVYDLNGSKGPNTFGKDIGIISALYASDSVVVAPLPLNVNANPAPQSLASKKCTEQDSESRLPTVEELSALFYNKLLVSIPSGEYLSSSVSVVNSVMSSWRVDFANGRRWVDSGRYSTPIRCIKR